MNIAETHDLLMLLKAYDNRNFDDATVLAWYPLVADLDADDVRQAVMRHFASSDAYFLPVHVRDGVKAIRNERAQSQPHEVRALPSRFEADEVRDERVRRGVQGLARLWSVPENDTAPGTALERALDRARRERKGAKATTPTRRRNTGGPGIQLDKVTRPPEWADPAVRERVSNNALHAAGNRCNRQHCPTCSQINDDELSPPASLHQEGPK